MFSKQVQYQPFTVLFISENKLHMQENNFFVVEKYIKQKYKFLDEVDINSDTLIEYDLGFAGDRAADFIIDFSKEFEIDISEFDFGYYFGHDGVDFIGISLLVNWFLNLFRKEKIVMIRDDFKPMTIDDLEKALDKKVLK
jgi:hypothetical protein